MKVKCFLLIILTTLFYAIPSYAVDVIDTYSWDSSKDSGVNYRGYNKDSIKSFYASINHSKDGEQRLYFYDIDSDVFVTPDYLKSSPNMRYLMSATTKSSTDTVTMIFNGQAVKMNKFTEVYYTTQKYYYYFTPETDKGHNYLINIFKKSQSPIKVEYLGEKFLIPSKGFTKKWNNKGGDAI